MSKPRAAKFLLLLSLLLAGADLGGSFYEHALVVPVWSADPPVSFSIIAAERGGLELIRFWIPIHGALTLALVATLLLHWKEPAARNVLLVGIGAYVVMRAWTFAYFIPELSAFMAMDPDATVDRAELTARVARWGTLSHGRTVLVLIMTVSLFVVLWRKLGGASPSNAGGEAHVPRGL